MEGWIICPDLLYSYILSILVAAFLLLCSKRIMYNWKSKFADINRVCIIKYSPSTLFRMSV